MYGAWTYVVAPFGFGGECSALNLLATSIKAGRGECEPVSAIDTRLRFRGITLMDKPFSGIHPLQVYNVQVHPAQVKSF